MFFFNFFFFCGILGGVNSAATIKANSHECVLGMENAFLDIYYNNTNYCIFIETRSVAAAGDGSTPGSCMSCDPTRPVCAHNCQAKINDMYYACDGVCLPDGYYFDPSKML
jgi:hypothetical protein